jgi:DNA-binding MarR family transcriptional regulator
MPLDEPPNLVSLLLAVYRDAVDELYRRLAQEGHGDLPPGSAVVFQHMRPGGSTVEELARLGRVSEAAVEEQTAALEASGHVERRDGRVDLTPRGRAAVDAGLRILTEIEDRWRAVLGSDGFTGFAGGLARLNVHS